MLDKAPTIVTVDGRNYSFYHVSPRILNAIVVNAAAIVGKPLAESFDKPVFSENSKEDNIKSIVSMLTSSLDADRVNNIIDRLFSSTTCEGMGKVSDNFDMIFDKKLVHMYKVAYAAFEHYFSDFFVEGSALLNLKKKKEADTTPAK
jgi:hypothetical protein